MPALDVTRLLQNPLGQVAPAGQRGDIVRVSDGVSTIYLDPAEYEAVSEETLRAMLAPAEPPPSAIVAGAPLDEPRMDVHPRRRRKPPEPVTRTEAGGSMTDPRRAGRRAQPLW